jgi:general secretion pathway protein F
MPEFEYLAATPRGAMLRGVQVAQSEALATRALRDRGLYPVRVTPSGGSPAYTGAAATSADLGARAQMLLRNRRDDVVQTMRYLATLVGAGFPLDRALGTVERVITSPTVRDAVRVVRARVRAGAHLADALAEHPRLFPGFAVGMARAGERGGTLGPALARLAEQLEREQALRARLTSAMLYPLMMLLVGSAAVAVLLLSVLPRLVELLSDAGAPVPRATAALLAFGDFLGHWWLFCLAGLLALALGFASYRRTPAGVRTIDRALIRLPIIGGLRRQRAAVRFGRALAALLQSGLPVIPALDVTADTVADRAVREEVQAAREQVRAGSRLAPALARGRSFPFLFVQMVEVGEDGGQLPEMLERGASTCEDELQRGLDRLVRLVEPLMILLFGGAIGFVALALLRAVYSVRVEGL